LEVFEKIKVAYFSRHCVDTVLHY